ncbi:MAG TPA: hypothetical protein H9915_08720 [Candidatus Gemmiger faecigallinarum]|nr:hypothetical protein [Candidatus Gemmiger faecigallinarum]
MEKRSFFLLRETEEFMRGELDNVTVAESHILLDVVQGGYVPYGCYTSPPIPLPAFDALRPSWNAFAPPGTAVEVQARVMVDGNWTAWSSFGRWSPFLHREGARPLTRGPLNLTADQLALDSKVATQAQLRIYLYTKDEKQTPRVALLGASVRVVDVIPGGGRPVNASLRLPPYAVARRAPALQPQMDLACSIASLTNRWGADILPEELAMAIRDWQGAPNLCFGAAAAGCWGFPAWVRWADLGALREELRAGCGVVVELESTPTQQQAGLPERRYAALRGFASLDGQPHALLNDPYAADTDFETEVSMPLDDFLVAWTNVALCLRQRRRIPMQGRPARASVWLRPAGKDLPGIYRMTLAGEERLLPDDFCGSFDLPTGVLAWTAPEERPHATTAHKLFHFVQPVSGGVQLPAADGQYVKYTVYAIDAAGSMLVGDVTV